MLTGSEASLKDIANVVAQDVAIAGKVLQLANSAFFWRARRVSRLDDAVNALGVNPLKALVLSAGAFESFRPTHPIDGFSLPALQQRGSLAAQLTRSLLAPGEARDDAFAAALLHDVGLLVLLTQEPQHLAESLAVAARDGRALEDVEHELRGTTHAELGAHLLELRGLPHAVVETVAFHHRPADVHDPVLDATAAVGIANWLVEGVARGASPSATQIGPGYLETLGVVDRVAVWRQLARASSAGL